MAARSAGTSELKRPHRFRALPILAAAAALVGGAGCGGGHEASAPPSLRVSSPGTPTPSTGAPATQAVPSPAAGTTTAAGRTGGSGSGGSSGGGGSSSGSGSSGGGSSSGSASGTPTASPSVTLSPIHIILGTGGYGCPGPGIPYSSFPTTAGAYASELYQAWVAGNKEGICELVILSGTDPLQSEAHTSTDNFLETFPFCQGAAGSTYCTYYSSNENRTLFMRIINSSLGGPHAVEQVSFEPGHYP